MLNEGNQIHNFMSSSGSGTVINYGSGSGSYFLTSYGSGSGSTSQKVTVPTVPVPQHCWNLYHNFGPLVIASNPRMRIKTLIRIFSLRLSFWIGIGSHVKLKSCGVQFNSLRPARCADLFLTYIRCILKCIKKFYISVIGFACTPSTFSASTRCCPVLEPIGEP